MRTKKDIVRHMMAEQNLSNRQARQVFQLVLDDIVRVIRENGRLELRNFGVFRVKHRAERVARNPRTNEALKLPARAVLTFEASQRIADVIQQAWPTGKPVKSKPGTDAPS